MNPVCAWILTEDYRQQARKYLGGGGVVGAVVSPCNSVAHLKIQFPIKLQFKDEVRGGFEEEEEEMRTAPLTAGTDLVFTHWMWADFIIWLKTNANNHCCERQGWESIDAGVKEWGAMFEKTELKNRENKGQRRMNLLSFLVSGDEKAHVIGG